jgi:hypothetical protein
VCMNFFSMVMMYVYDIFFLVWCIEFFPGRCSQRRRGLVAWG